MDSLKKYIRAIPDHPKPGIRFYDITTLMLDPRGLQQAIDAMETFARGQGTQKIVGIESRGFVFGGALADRLDVGLVLARKFGKLPGETVSQEYALEYGTDRLEIHADAIAPGENVLVVDDLIATGGTLQAVCRMIERMGARVCGISAVVELSYLPWWDKLQNYDVHCLVSFDSE